MEVVSEDGLSYEENNKGEDDVKEEGSIKREELALEPKRTDKGGEGGLSGKQRTKEECTWRWRMMRR